MAGAERSCACCLTLTHPDRRASLCANLASCWALPANRGPEKQVHATLHALTPSAAGPLFSMTFSLCSGDFGVSAPFSSVGLSVPASSPTTLLSSSAARSFGPLPGGLASWVGARHGVPVRLVREPPLRAHLAHPWREGVKEPGMCHPEAECVILSPFASLRVNCAEDLQLFVSR
jgi:hypothetical protein